MPQNPQEKSNLTWIDVVFIAMIVAAAIGLVYVLLHA
jgi:hypothetical protein